MLGFKNGKVALYDNEDDRMSFIIKTNLVDVNKAEWNLTGDVFAISGNTLISFIHLNYFSNLNINKKNNYFI